MSRIPAVAELAISCIAEVEKIGVVVAGCGVDADLIAAAVNRARDAVIEIMLDVDWEEEA